MVTGLWTEFLLSLACASAIAWLAALVKTQPKSGRILIGAAIASAWIIAGAKPGGVRSGDGAPAVAGGGCLSSSSIPMAFLAYLLTR